MLSRKYKKTTKEHVKDIKKKRKNKNKVINATKTFKR